MPAPAGAGPALLCGAYRHYMHPGFQTSWNRQHMHCSPGLAARGTMHNAVLAPAGSESMPHATPASATLGSALHTAPAPSTPGHEPKSVWILEWPE